MNKWTSVKKKLPAIQSTDIPIHLHETIMFTDGVDRFVGFCLTFCGDEDARGVEWYCVNYDKDKISTVVLVKNVTHWMNAPELPK